MIWIISIAIVLAAAGTYVTFLYLGKIKDTNKNFVPDALEDAAKEAGESVDAVAEEIVEAIDAAKGKKKKK